MDNEFSFEPRVVEPSVKPEDFVMDNDLRPQHLDEYIGQETVKENLRIAIEAAKMRNEVLDHILLYGPPGLGKTTLARIIANEMGVNIRVTSGPAIEKPGDLAAIITNLQENDILFIDEIHRLSRNVEEVLYPALEDYVLDLIIGKGPSARSIRINIPKFTLIGATTKAGSLTNPLRDRFGLLFKLDTYKESEILEIIRRSSAILGIECDEEGARQLARCSRGTPRIANRFLKRARDYAVVKADGYITKEIAEEALSINGVDALGLDNLDRKLLRSIIQNYSGGPVGLETLAATLGEDAGTLEDVCEPYLLQIGFLMRTPRGRCVTPKAYSYLGITAPAGANANYIQENLFER